jgi:MFS family permease
MSVHRGRAALLAALGVDMAGSGLFLPISLLYFLAVTELRLETIGLLLSVATIVSLPVPVIVGHLVDRFGPRGIVVAAQVLQGLGFAAYGWASGPVSVLVPAMVVAVGQRMFWSSFFTLVADQAEPGRSGEDSTFARVSMVQAAGTGLGALIAGFALTGDAGTYRLVVMIDAASYLISAVLLCGVPRARSRGREEFQGSYADLFRDRPFLAFLGVNAIFALCAVMVGVAVPVYLVDGLPDAPRWLAGPLLTFNTVLLATGQTVMVRLVRRLPRVRALALGALLMAFWSLALAFALRVPHPLLIGYLAGAMALFAAGELIIAPVANALAASAAPDHLRGRYLAIMQYGFATAQVVAPTFFTVLYSRGRAWPFLALAVLATVASAVIARSSLGGNRSHDTSVPAGAVRAGPGE